ncbi:MAG TPA: TlpA disulfide reductase family protein [Thermoanaerobaculia bacterium]|nr:TlpA disulfide reductase family protein [Thermoanaerobaculia bacterium]
MLALACSPAPRPRDRHGNPVDVDLRGAPVTLLHFWAAWCGPCREELPRFMAFAATHHLRVVAVSHDRDFTSADRFLRQQGIPLERYWTITAASPPGTTSASFQRQSRSTPTQDHRPIRSVGGLERSGGRTKSAEVIKPEIRDERSETRRFPDLLSLISRHCGIARRDKSEIKR